MFSARHQCSVTCGEGQQTRDVFCAGLSGDRLADHACSSLQRPPAVQPCHRPRCPVHITWHVGDFGLVCTLCYLDQPPPHPVWLCWQWLTRWHVVVQRSLQCTRRCGGGVRDRRVGCYDTDLNPYSEHRCRSTDRPVAVESCNTQPCPEAQSKHSIPQSLYSVVCVFLLI